MATTFERKNKDRAANSAKQDDLSAEVAVLRKNLARAEARALEAEAALPNLLGLGQSTVNELLDEARAQAAALLKDAQEQVAIEREKLAQDRAELEVLYMAIAAEAAALKEMRRRVEGTGVALSSVAEGIAEVELSDQGVDDLKPEIANLKAQVFDLERIEAVPVTNGFAKAWEQEDDASQLEAFARFFGGDTEEIDPSRRWIMDDSEG